MRKTLMLMFVFFFLSGFIFSQTWTERDDDCDFELKVLTKDEWNRLLKQKESEFKYAKIHFTNVLEADFLKANKVIKGTKPTLRGYYYLLVYWTPRSKEKKTAFDLFNFYMELIYGNDITGEMSIRFLNSSGYLLEDTHLIGSESYRRRYNQCIGWVNGK